MQKVQKKKVTYRDVYCHDLPLQTFRTTKWPCRSFLVTCQSICRQRLSSNVWLIMISVCARRVLSYHVKRHASCTRHAISFSAWLQRRLTGIHKRTDGRLSGERTKQVGFLFVVIVIRYANEIWKRNCDYGGKQRCRFQPMVCFTAQLPALTHIDDSITGTLYADCN